MLMPARLARHGPARIHLALREPGRLFHRGMSKAQAHRRRRWRFQRHVEPGNASVPRVDGHRQPGPANRFAVHGIDEDQIYSCVVHLDKVQHVPPLRRVGMHRLGLGKLLPTLPPLGEGERLDAAPDGARRWRAQPLGLAPPDDDIDNRRDRPAL
jgi:hypothetical protein